MATTRRLQAQGSRYRLCGEGATAIFLAKQGYDVTAFDLSLVGVEKTKVSAIAAEVNLKVFRADINEFVPQEEYDVLFSSGTLQYLLPEKRREFIERFQLHTRDNGLHVLQTFVKKPFVKIAPDAEASEYLWSLGELLQYYRHWLTKDFFEEIKPCNSSGISHEHVHNRIWSQKIR